MAKKLGGIWLILGAVAGALATLFFSTDEEGQTHAPVKSKVAQAKRKLKEMQEQDAVKQIFGKHTEEWTKQFRKTKDQVAKQLASLKGSLEEIDKQKYLDVVNSVITELKENSKMTTEQVNKMKAYLQADYKKLQDNTKPAKAKKKAA